MRNWILNEETAEGIVQRWGLQDDSVAGHDLRMRIGGGGGGYIEDLVERFHCARGIADAN